MLQHSRLSFRPKRSRALARDRESRNPVITARCWIASFAPHLQCPERQPLGYWVPALRERGGAALAWPGRRPENAEAFATGHDPPHPPRLGLACRAVPGGADGDHRADVVLDRDLVRVSAARLLARLLSAVFRQ